MMSSMASEGMDVEFGGVVYHSLPVIEGETDNSLVLFISPLTCSDEQLSAAWIYTHLFKIKHHLYLHRDDTTCSTNNID